MDFVKVATVDEFALRKIKSFTIDGEKVAVVKKEDGSFFARESSCKHQGADLTMGMLRGQTVTCPRHGWKFDLETGQCLNRTCPPLKKYELKVEDGEIHVSDGPIE